MTPNRVRVSEILGDCGDLLNLRVLVPGKGLEAQIGDSDIGRPGLLLAGHDAGFRPDRLQVLDDADLLYLAGMGPEERRSRFAKLIDLGIPCVVIAGGAGLPGDLLELASSRGLPVLSAQPSATQVSQYLNTYLLVRLAPESSVTGTLVDVHGVGILLTGKSGIGKSECALALVERGHRLVADDLIRTIAKPPGVLIGRSSEPLQSYVEVRGVGLVDIGSIYGIRALRRQKRIEIEVALKEWADGADYDRSGLDSGEREIMGVRIPSTTVPLVPGKSVSVIVEVIALSHILKSYGYDSAQALDKRWLEALRSQGDRSFKFRDVE
jgi:HPr kinase/phosphorylase